MKNILLIICLQAMTCYAQNSITSFNTHGFAEISDKAYFERLDPTVQRLYSEHMEYYNIGMKHYQEGKAYDMAYFYFDKAFNPEVFKKSKVTPEQNALNNKAYYAFLSILKMPKYESRYRRVINARQLVDDLCDPEKKKLAYEEWGKWKNRKDEKPDGVKNVF